MKQIIKLSKPANECRACGILGNTLMNIDLESMGVKLHELDITHHPEAVEEYGIFSVPVLIFLDENGKEYHRLSGSVPADLIIECLN